MTSPVASETETPFFPKADDIGHPVVVHIRELAGVSILAAPATSRRRQISPVQSRRTK